MYDSWFITHIYTGLLLLLLVFYSSLIYCTPFPPPFFHYSTILLRILLLFMMLLCKDKRCKTCPAIGKLGNLTLEYTACKTSNVIYMIRCGVWDIKYVGQTGLPLNLRINNHRKLCNNNNFDDRNNYYNSSKHEFEHFRIHSFNNLKHTTKILNY